MVSARPPISNCSSPFSKPLGIVPSAPIGITVTFMFHSFFTSPARTKYLSFFFFLRFLWCLHSCPPGRQSSLVGRFFLFFNITRSVLAGMKWSVCIWKSPRILCVSFSWKNFDLCIYHLAVWSNFNFLHNSQRITFPIQSCLILYSFGARFLYSFIMWLIVSSLSPHNLLLPFCWVLSIFTLT